MTFSPPCISLLLNPPCVARQLRRYTGFPPSSVCSSTRSCLHRKAFAVRILEQFVSTSLFGMLLILFHNGFHPRAILVRLHPKAILGSELGEGGACALPSHCQRLVSMLCDIFFSSHFLSIVLHLRWCSAKKKLRKCLKDSTLLLKFLIPGVEVQCLLRISLRLNIASAWFALLI